MKRPLFRIRTIWIKTITVAMVSIGVVSIGSSVPAFAGVALSPGETIYAGETVTINEPSNAPPWVGSGSVYIAIDTGKSGAGSYVENVQGTENGNSVTFTLPANLSVSSGTPMYFLIIDPLSPYFTPNYTWGGGPPTGNLPEVPFAGTLPVMGLGGLVIVAYIRRRRRAS